MVRYKNNYSQYICMFISFFIAVLLLGILLYGNVKQKPFSKKITRNLIIAAVILFCAPFFVWMILIIYFMFNFNT